MADAHHGRRVVFGVEPRRHELLNVVNPLLQVGEQVLLIRGARLDHVRGRLFEGLERLLVIPDIVCWRGARCEVRAGDRYKTATQP